MKTIDKQRVISLLTEIASFNDELSEKQKQDFIFHMTDWLSDLEGLVRVFQDPDGVEKEVAYKVVLKFLIHATEHIVEASELFTDIPVDRIFKDK